jgi:hypothetical protein
MPRTGTIIFILGTIALTASAKVHAQDSSDMARCAELENADARLACYDEVIGRSISSRPNPEAAEKEPTRTAPRSEPVPLTQDVGEEQLDRKSRPKSEPTIVQGRVTGCQKDASNRWYFVFDNGQVWKQRSDDRLSFRECDFWVTITKDFFGYKMQIDGEKKRIRIGRIR